MSSDIVVLVDRELMRAEREDLARALGGRVRDGCRVSPRLLLTSDETSPGQSYTFGVDLGTVLLLALASGSALFLKRLTEEAADDVWRALKNLVHRIGHRNRAIPIQSTQFQFSAGNHQGVEILVVVTALNVRFVADETWTALMESWRSELVGQLAEQRREIEQGNAPPDRCIVLHAVIHGGSAPVWHVSSGSR